MTIVTFVVKLCAALTGERKKVLTKVDSFATTKAYDYRIKGSRTRKAI